MCLLLREALTVGRIAFSPFFTSVELEIREAKHRLKDEILNYCVITEAPKTTFGKARIHGTLLNLCPLPTLLSDA